MRTLALDDIGQPRLRVITLHGGSGDERLNDRLIVLVDRKVLKSAFSPFDWSQVFDGDGAPFFRSESETVHDWRTVVQRILCTTLIRYDAGTETSRTSSSSLMTADSLRDAAGIGSP